MKSQHLFVTIGLSLAICAPFAASAQTMRQMRTKFTAVQPQRQNSGAATVRRSGLPPGFFDQTPPRGPITGPGNPVNEPGDLFTESNTGSVTRAGTVGVMTGTAGSDVNAQIGTTNQGNLVHGPMGGIFTAHFGSSGSRKQPPVRAHRSPRAKQNDVQ